MTEKEIEEGKEKIDRMSYEKMARMWRFTPAGHVLFNKELPLFKHFDKRFKAFGGMTSELSKKIGWG